MTAALRLYDTVDALQTVESWLIEHDGELTPELSELLDQALGDFGAKVERVALKVRELEQSAEAVKAEATRLAARAKSYETAAARLKAYLHLELQRAGRDKVEGPNKLATVAVQKNSAPAVTFTRQPTDDDAAFGFAVTIPEQVIPASVQWDRAALVAAFKSNAPLPDGVEITVGTHVRIR